MFKCKHKQDAASVHTTTLKLSGFRCDDAMILQTDGTRASNDLFDLDLVEVIFHAKKWQKKLFTVCRMSRFPVCMCFLSLN